MMRRALPAAMVAAILLQACAVGPNYRRPETPLPESFRGQEVVQPESLADLPWWQVFQDDELQALITEALRNNYDLQTAVARVEQARGVLVSTRSAIFPQGSYNAEAARGRSFFGFTGNRTFNTFLATFNLSWEIDLWGRIRRATESARADLLASNEARRGVIVQLVSQVATQYLSLRELDVELEINQRATKTFQDTLELFQRQFEGGIGTKLAVERGAAALAQAAALIPDTERRIVATENAIGILLGWPPTPIPRGTTTLTREDLPPRPPAGLPADLLERRPDVQQNEEQLRSSNAQVGVAVADFFPRIGLTALYGGQSTELEMIVKGPGNVWQIAASVAGPLFQGGRLIGNYKSAKANWEATKWQYEQTVLTALREVSDALVDADKLVAVRDEDAKAVAALQEASDLATVRYTGGLATYFEVLEAQQQLFPAERTLAQTELQQLLAVVELYRALGGGWTVGEEELPLNAFPNWPN
ncbi:MAG TPA: efflux transporter outer membrane subunit [Candidatus Binatia bacterium]|nr:efflux transporter outer membrane subunit [Candidatus Binatia bacterium]